MSYKRKIPYAGNYGILRMIETFGYVNTISTQSRTSPGTNRNIRQKHMCSEYVPNINDIKETNTTNK